MATGAVAAAAGVDIGTAAGAAAAGLGFGGTVLDQIGSGVRLRSQPAGVVAETSPRGRALQDICSEIARACREANELPICVLIDGFGPDDFDLLKTLLERRIGAAELDPERDVEPGLLARIAAASGGLPRHAVQIAHESVKRVLSAGASQMTEAHVNVGIQVVAEQLGRGLNMNHLKILGIVRARHQLPGDTGAATLFADGRILAYPPAGGSHLPRFEVHPLLDRDVEAFMSSEDLSKLAGA
jgi:hypothetical protein